MNEIGGIFTAITCCALLIISIVVGRSSSSGRNIKAPGLAFFVLSCVTLAIWLAANTISDIDTQRGIFWVRVSFASVSVAIYAFLMFVNRFPVSRYASKRETAMQTAALLIVVGAIFTDKFIPRLEFSEGVGNVVPGPLYGLFVIYLVAILVLAMTRLEIGRRMAKKRYRIQARIIQIGVLLTAIIAMTTNLILPLLLGQNNLYWLASAATLVFVGSTAYSIARYSLFDIRVAVVRALAYLLTVATLFVVCSAALFFGIFNLVGVVSISFYQQLFIIGIAVLLGFFIPLLTKLFDYVTRRIFFRTTYEPQEVLAQLGNIVENDVDIQVFTRRVIHLLEEVLHPEFIVLTIIDKEDEMSVFSKHKNSLKRSTIRELIAGNQEQVLMLSEQYDISQSVILNTAHSSFGCLILGYKQDGNAYSSTDVNFINVYADELGLALQNILRLKEIKVFNSTLQNKVAEATSELRQTNKKLYELDESKDEFISMASHQLRTPLTTVKGYISMLLDGDVGKITPQQRKVLEEAFSSSQRMVYLIGDFLNVSRLQNGKFELELRSVSLPEIVAQEVKQMEEGARSRRMILNYTQPSDIPPMLLDENKIRQVIMNFIDNAVYYSNPGDSIRITLTQYNGYVSMKVIDHGIGVPPSERHRLFTKFYRASNAKKRRPDGTGIGLFMARKVITSHRGSIIFETVEGKGSTFGFRLPLK